MKKYKLSKKSKNLIIAVITSITLIMGIKYIVKKAQANNNQNILTQEEIAQSEALLARKNKEEKEETDIDYATIGYLFEAGIIAASAGTGIYLFKKHREETGNLNKKIYFREDNPVIGSKVRPVSYKKQYRKYKNPYNQTNRKRHKKPKLK